VVVWERARRGYAARLRRFPALPPLLSSVSVAGKTGVAKGAREQT
jgi:hypothetical protein